MKRYLIYTLLFMLVLCIFQSFCMAEDMKFEISLDDSKLYLGEATRLNVKFLGNAKIPPPDFDRLKNFEVQYTGMASSTAFINGKITASVVYTYRLIPLKTGKFKIGPLNLTYNTEKYTSNSVVIEVLQSSGSAQTPAAQPKSQPDQSISLQDKAFVVMEVPKTQVYVNELIPLTIKLYSDKIPLRDIEFPVFPHEGFSVEEFKEPKQYTEELGGVLYELIEFKTNIFALEPGKLKLGPANINCKLLVRNKQRRSGFFDNDDFFEDSLFGGIFGGYQTHPLSLKSTDVAIDVLDVPQQGKPDTFNGAIGKFALIADASPKEVKAGDPITLKIIIKGIGNFNTVKAPVFKNTDGFKIYDAQVTKETDRKVFEQVIIPKSEKIKQIPSISFSYFDPEEGVYKTLTKGPFDITVQKADSPQGLKIVEMPRVQVDAGEETLGRDIVFIKETTGKLYSKDKYIYDNKLFWIFNIALLLFSILIAGVQLRVQKLKSDINYARHLHAPKKARKALKQIERCIKDNKTDEFYDLVYKTLKEYLGDKFHTASASITSDIIDEVLRPKNIDENILDNLKQIFDDCDMARYAPSQFNIEKMQTSFNQLQRVIDAVERCKI